jgi:hypothetical protein
MQAQATRPLLSGLTTRQARILWLTLCNARHRAWETGELADDLSALAEDVENAFAGLFGDLEICEYPTGDVYLAPYQGDATGLDESQAIVSATAGAR